MESLPSLALLSPVSRKGSPIIKCLKSREIPNSFLVSTGNQFLYHFEEEQLVSTFKFTAEVVCVDSVREKGCFVITRDGRLSFITLDKKARWHAGIKAKNQCEESRNQEIFSELLNSNDAMSSEPQIDNVKTNSCTDTFNVVNIPVLDTAVYMPGVLNILCISSSVIITGGVNEIGCCVSLHNVHGLEFVKNPLEQPRTTISSLCQSTIPMGVTEPFLNPLTLTCVWPSESLSNAKPLHILDRTVFEPLFGIKASLFDSCVLLVGTCEGHIYFFPLASDMASQDVLTPKKKLKQPSLLQNTKEKENHSFSLVPSLLYFLEQPVSAISLARIPFKEARDKKVSAENPKVTYGNCVLFVGKRDKVVVSYKNRSSLGTGTVVFAECQIPGPVWCSTVNATSNVIMHSTGKELFISKVEIQHSEFTSQATSEKVVITTIHCIKIPFVCAMVYITPDTLQQQGNKLIVLNLKGKLQKLDISNIHDSSSRFLLMKISPKVAGNKIKCLLSEMERLSEKLSKLNLLINAEDTILKDLNIATSLICRIMGKQAQKHYLMSKEGSDCTIDIQCSVMPIVRAAMNLTGPLVSLECKVINHWALTFGKGWSLLVQISVREQETVNTTGCQKTTSKAVPLNLFASGQCFVLNFPLNSVAPFYSVRVMFFLHFDLNAVLSNLDRTISAESVVIPLDVKVLDLIDFLGPVTRNKSCFESSGHFSVNRHPIPLQHKISTAVKNIDISQTDGLKSVSNNTTTQYITSAQSPCQSILHLSQSCVHYIHQHVQANKHYYGTKGSVTPEESVLIFLTSGNKAFMPSDSRQDFVKAETPTGEKIELQVQPRSESINDVSQNEMREECYKHELILRAPTVQLICSLHEAILSRLKTVMQRSTQSEELIPSSHVHEILERARGIQYRLEEIENSFQAEVSSQHRACSEKALPTRDHVASILTPQIIKLYQELRQNNSNLPIT